MAVSAFEHPVLAHLVGDAEMAAFFTPEAEFSALLRFEAALAEAEAAVGIIPADSAAAIAEACAAFVPDVGRLGPATARDGVIMPDFVAQLRALLPVSAQKHLHFGATSQDAIDTALVLRLRGALGLLDQRLAHLAVVLTQLAARDGSGGLMARTRMQVAEPFTAADKIGRWMRPLLASRDGLAALSASALRLQFGGAVGTLGALGGKGREVATRLGALLELPVPEQAWHTERAELAALGQMLATLCGALGKFGQDVALMALNEIGEATIAGGGTSSAMPHKNNPVAAEVLVALARYAATLSPGMLHALVHENERSGAAWTLEWLVLPQLFASAGGSTRLALRLAQSLTLNTRKPA